VLLKTLIDYFLKRRRHLMSFKGRKYIRVICFN
jgi:hypothetical protein